jgi:type IV pilus assembly protein PilW
MNLRPPHTRLAGQRGVSMVELMIAMLLGLFLMAAMLQLFSSNKSTYTNMEGLSQIQENARAGIERLKSRVRMAGYMGCSNLDILEPNNITVPTVNFNANVLITGTDNDSNTSNSIVDATDTVSIISATLANTALSADMTADDSDVLLTNPKHFQVNDLMIITDCENADIFRISNIDTSGLVVEHKTTTGVNSSNILSKAYLANSTRVMSMQNVTYSVQDTSRVDESGNAVLSLFETPTGGARIEIMTGVEDMQITYGEDTSNDGEADVYRDASTVASWANVVSIRINLLVSTDRGIGPDQRTYINLAGATVTGDRRMRRAFTTTISLRNRSS